MSVFDVLYERGFIAQVTHEEEIKQLLSNESVTFYTGYDPTASSLHVGNFLTLMGMAHMQKAGHRPIAMIGGATAMIGDPSGRTDMRQMLTIEEIEYNGNCFKKQMASLIDFCNDRALLLNNAEWILSLNYMEVLRNIGSHFSVNRMLTADCYKQRMERGLSFLELNYMIMQAYDFLELNRHYDCVLQIGGDDQWSNILAGVDLIRRKERRQALGMTFPLLTTSNGKKMGKTEKGAIWLDPKKTSPYEFFQYWRNVADDVVERCLALLTFLPMSEVRKLGALRSAEINEAKKILAFEVTKIIHGQNEADKTAQAAEAVFGRGGEFENIPTITISLTQVGMLLADVLLGCGIFSSKSEVRRIVQQGGLYLNGERIDDQNTILKLEMFDKGEAMLRKGKKTFFRIRTI